MDCYVGIDLGSTTSKAIYMDENEKVIGWGITNSRSNYVLACQIAQEEAEINSRFTLLRKEIEKEAKIGDKTKLLMDWLSGKFDLGQHLEQLAALKERCLEVMAESVDKKEQQGYRKVLDDMLNEMEMKAVAMFVPDEGVRSDFFRDIATSQFLDLAEKFTKDTRLSLDRLVAVFDRAISLVEGESFAGDFGQYLSYATAEVLKKTEFIPYQKEITRATNYVAGIEFRIINTIGTGYGRQTLPFPRHQIRSEILCHGLGAHYMFPNTRTVLDIGGQDTKGIQVDENGIVTNFQMNDRCAAGCGRYLGYIANEMNIGVHELGPAALKSTKNLKINSTCTVFAGAELRERLSLGEKREDILRGIHRAIILRAMSLLARSGGVFNEFTFTGGVARNKAATDILKEVIRENYGEITINISADSIYTGAIGAALFAKRDQKGDLVNVDLKELRKKKPVKKK